jgi:hypothetical protein
MTDVEISCELARELYSYFAYGISPDGKSMIQGDEELTKKEMWFWGNRKMFVNRVRETEYFEAWESIHKTQKKDSPRSRIESLLIAVRMTQPAVVEI